MPTYEIKGGKKKLVAATVNARPGVKPEVPSSKKKTPEVAKEESK